MRSCAIPPKIMAPMRPLPTGRASTHSLAGARYHSVSGDWAAATDATARTTIGRVFIISKGRLAGPLPDGPHPLDRQEAEKTLARSLPRLYPFTATGTRSRLAI